MHFRSTVVAVAALMCLSVAAGAQDAKKYPAFEGLWDRGSPLGSWDPTKPPGRGQQAPLTPEYQGVYEANIAKDKAGLVFDPKFTCGPVGMPRVMNMNQPMEFIIKPTVIYMLLESQSPIRRIYTGPGPRILTAAMSATPSASGSTRTTPASTTRSRSRPAP
jgi:hypothetical protein